MGTIRPALILHLLFLPTEAKSELQLFKLRYNLELRFFLFVALKDVFVLISLLHLLPLLFLCLSTFRCSRAAGGLLQLNVRTRFQSVSPRRLVLMSFTSARSGAGGREAARLKQLRSVVWWEAEQKLRHRWIRGSGPPAFSDSELKASERSHTASASGSISLRFTPDLDH